MSPEEIEKAINQIAWGGRFIQVRTYDGALRPIIVKPLSVRERNFVDFIYSSSLKEARDNGALSKIELYSIYKTKGLWTNKDDESIEDTSKKIRELENIAEEVSSRDKKRVEIQIRNLLKQYRNAVGRRDSLFSNSAESYADERRILATVFCSTYDDQEKKMWSDWTGFLTSVDNSFVSSIMSGLNSGVISQYTAKEMREVARSNQWRFRWSGAKSIGDLFGKPISEFTSEQQSLLYWSQIYDSVYESMDRPSDDIINNDEALDKWFDDQTKKNKQRSFDNSGDIGKIKISEDVRRHGEIFVIANKAVNPNAPEIQEISGLNTELVRKFKKKEEEKIKEAGSINEKDLRERGNRFARKIIGSSDAVLGKNSFGQAKGGKRAKNVLPGGSIG